MQSQKNSRKRRAASLVEFALVFPMFVVMIMATLDFGRYMYIQSTMSHVVRAALRYGVTEQQQVVVTGTKSTTLSVRQSIINAAISANPVPQMIPVTAGTGSASGNDTFYIDIAAPTGTSWSNAQMSVSATNTPWKTLSSSYMPVQISGQLLRVTYNYNFKFATPLIGFITGGTNNTKTVSVQTIYQAEVY
ncbi:MAG: pilus assembly protein [Verrucomicrobiales bacterium]|jgi:Flp pilus assembly protein TadG|nr:pilus assembly protein [Verrucomicrobiales bacterium]